VLFTGKVDERIRIVDVLFIPCLKNIIASLGQLDENGCKVAIETGVLRVWDCQCRLLVKIKRNSSQLYVLQINVVRCLPRRVPLGGRALARALWSH
jgi:hypothetical protein